MEDSTLPRYCKKFCLVLTNYKGTEPTRRTCRYHSFKDNAAGTMYCKQLSVLGVFVNVLQASMQYLGQSCPHAEVIPHVRFLRNYNLTFSTMSKYSALDSPPLDIL